MSNRLLVVATSGEVEEGTRVFHAEVASHEHGASGEGGAAPACEAPPSITLGHVVGIDFFNNAAGELRAFLHDGTTMIDLTEHLSQRKPKGEHSELLPEADRVTRQEKRPRLVWWSESGVSGKLFKRVTDAKAREAMVVAIGCHPLAAAFNGQCGEKGIRNEVAFDIGCFAQAAKDVPVAETRIDDGASRLVTQLFCKRQSLIHAAWRIEHVRVGDDSEEAAQDQIGQTIGIVGVDKVFKPPAIWMMVR